MNDVPLDYKKEMDRKVNAVMVAVKKLVKFTNTLPSTTDTINLSDGKIEVSIKK